MDTDLQVLLGLRLKHSRDFLFGLLHINGLRNKVLYLRKVVRQVQFEYFVISETKLDLSFPFAQFKLADYETRARRDKNEKGGGIIEYVRKSVICKRQKEFETTLSESISSESIISSKKIVLYEYISPNASRQLQISLRKLSKKLFVLSFKTSVYEMT